MGPWRHRSREKAWSACGDRLLCWSEINEGGQLAHQRQLVLKEQWLLLQKGQVDERPTHVLIPEAGILFHNFKILIILKNGYWSFPSY